MMRRAASRLSRAKSMSGWAGFSCNKRILDQRGRGPVVSAKKQPTKFITLEGFEGFPWSYEDDPILFETGSLMGLRKSHLFQK